MRYTEKELPTDDGIVQKVLKVASAPYRLINELSIKIIFLERKVTEQVLLTAILIGLGMLAVRFIVGGLVLSSFSLTEGHLSFLVQLLVEITLVAYYLYYELHEFKIYQHIDHLVHIVVSSTEDLASDGVDVSMLEDEDGDEDNTENSAKWKLSKEEEEYTEQMFDEPTKEPVNKPTQFREPTPVNLSLLDDDEDDLGIEPAAVPVENKTAESKPVENKVSKSKSSNTAVLSKPIKFEDLTKVHVPVIESIKQVDAVVDYQDRLKNLLADFTEAGIPYAGSLDQSTVESISNNVKSAEKFKEAEISDDFLDDIDNFVIDYEIGAVEMLETLNNNDLLQKVV